MRTEWLCEKLDELQVSYFREPFMNIVTLPAQFITKTLEEKYDLVPQKHGDDNQWYKIVIMGHVEVDHLSTFIADLKETIHAKKGITLEV
jgi:hypothetical protein